jgi:hypothetical protein
MDARGRGHPAQGIAFVAGQKVQALLTQAHAEPGLFHMLIIA